MKKLFVILLTILIVVNAYATVTKVSVERNVATKLLRLKSIATTIAGRLINIRDSVAQHSSQIDPSDLTKLIAIKSEMNAAITALNGIVSEIDANFPDIE